MLATFISDAQENFVQEFLLKHFHPHHPRHHHHHHHPHRHHHLYHVTTFIGNAQDNVVKELSSTEQRSFFHLRLEVDWEPENCRMLSIHYH